MVATRSSPRKASKVSKTHKGSKSTPRTIARSTVGVTKPRRAPTATSKAHRSREERFLPAESSPGTISPVEIPETDLEAPQDLHPVIAKLKRRLAKLENGQNAHLKGHRVKDLSPRPRRRTRHSSDSEVDSIEDSDQEDTNRVSFRHLEGTRPFLALHSRYRSVNVKYFKQILYGTFQAENLTKLGHGLTNRGVSDTPQDPKGVTQLLQCFGVYAMAVIYYAKESVRLDLTWALEEYRYRLADYSYAYKFDSLREYNYAFMTARILEGQEDPLAWRTEDPRCSILLRLKTSPNEAARPSAAKSSIPGYGICQNFNQGRCTREQCKYSHICLRCQQNHPANTCQKAQTSASAANTTPLGNRVSRPE